MSGIFIQSSSDDMSPKAERVETVEVQAPPGTNVAISREDEELEEALTVQVSCLKVDKKSPKQNTHIQLISYYSHSEINNT